jgi:NAD+ synthase (glutamine-hydrolysing)
MKITIAQLNYHIGNFEGNTAGMIVAIEQAKQAKADIICFSELATCGYPPRDFLEFDDFIRLSDECIQTICNHAIDIAVVIGAPSHNKEPKGKSLFNSVYFLADGKVQFVQHKTLLPTYDIFDEYRYFEPAKSWNVVEYKGKKIALTVCEDIWDVGTDDPLYTIIPMDEMMQFQPDFMINVSASPFNYDHARKRIDTVKSKCAQIWYSYVLYQSLRCTDRTYF